MIWWETGAQVYPRGDWSGCLGCIIYGAICFRQALKAEGEEDFDGIHSFNWDRVMVEDMLWFLTTLATPLQKMMPQLFME